HHPPWQRPVGGGDCPRGGMGREIADSIVVPLAASRSHAKPPADKHAACGLASERAPCPHLSSSPITSSGPLTAIGCPSTPPVADPKRSETTCCSNLVNCISVESAFSRADR